MKKGLHVIRAIWKGADCNFPPIDETYYSNPPIRMSDNDDLQFLVNYFKDDKHSSADADRKL